MQFHAQILLDEDASPGSGLLLLFVCANVATCPRWDANRGANHARVVPTSGLELLAPPSPACSLGFVVGAREERFTVTIDPDADDAYEEARERWGGVARQRQVLGRVGGDYEPIDWPVPTCACGASMQFVAQLEEGPDPEREMNFAGGSLVAYVCASCPGAAKILYE